MTFIVGVVETHGRKETEALLEVSKPYPASASSIEVSCWRRWDLDAIIARHPQIVLVDELAHTNAPGSRHPEAVSRRSKSC